MGPIGCSETSVRNRYITLLKIPKERSVITGGRILKSLSDIFLNIILLFTQWKLMEVWMYSSTTSLARL